MPDYLVQNHPYQQFTMPPTQGFYGLGPGLEVDLIVPSTGERIPGLRALLDTGTFDTYIYKSRVPLDSTRADCVPQTGQIIIRLEIARRRYTLPCFYRDHPSVEMNMPFAGTEDILIGLDLMYRWLVELNGHERSFTIQDLP